MTPLTLTFPLPPSANRYWRTGNGHVYLSAEAVAYKQTVGWTAREQGISDPWAGDLGIRLRVYRARKAGDLDNKIKVILDALNGVAWLDDSQIVYIEAHRKDDKDNPRIELDIWRQDCGC